MINNRIKELIEILDLSYSEFADHIGVQRSSISHLISGRNKPSLDFIEKLHEHYPDLNSDWLLFGTGVPFGKIRKAGDASSPALFDKPEIESKSQTNNIDEKINASDLKIPDKDSNENAVRDSQRLGKSVKSIIILYDDGSFEEVTQKIS